MKAINDNYCLFTSCEPRESCLSQEWETVLNNMRQVKIVLEERIQALPRRRH